MRLLALTIVSVLALSGCFVPRSAGYGQTAALLNPGELEVSLQPGFSYQIDNDPPQQSQTSSSSGLSFPASEGNAAIGLSDAVGLNVHLSSAGIQPGAKIALVKGPLNLSILPELAFAVFTQNSTTNNSSAGTRTFAGLMGGFKLLASHESGLYGGLGYDLQWFSASGPVGIVGLGTRDQTSSTTSHNISVAAGFELKMGMVRIRPELAMIIAPALSVSNSQQNTTVTNSGGSLFYIFPNVTFGVVGSSKSNG